jgi:hypothetical protein
MTERTEGRGEIPPQIPPWPAADAGGTEPGGAAAAGRRSVRAPFTMVALLAGVDLFITIWCYHRRVYFREGNPFAAPLLRHGQYTALVLLKLGSLAAFFGLLYVVRRRFAAVAAAWLGVLIYALVLAQWVPVLWVVRHRLF